MGTQWAPGQEQLSFMTFNIVTNISHYQQLHSNIKRLNNLMKLNIAIVSIVLPIYDGYQEYTQNIIFTITSVPI